LKQLIINLKGWGEYIWRDGRKYTGQFVDGKMHGKGTFEWVNGKAKKIFFGFNFLS
jgi:hypothetical protein